MRNWSPFQPASSNFSFSHRVPYREIRNNYRPIVTVDFAIFEEIVSVPMLVDTGADNIVLPQSFADVLGVEMSECCQITANTVHHGTVCSYKLKGARLSLSDIRADIWFPCEICFMPNLDAYGYGLLGREILDRIRLCFTHSPEYAFYISFNECN